MKISFVHTNSDFDSCASSDIQLNERRSIELNFKSHLWMNATISDFQNVIDFYSRSEKHKCTFSWSSPTYAIHCEECSKQVNACICIHCYLNSNHDKHHLHHS